MGKLINEIGNRYGRLIAVEKIKKENDTRAFWKCQCDCGNIIIVSGRDLRNGHTKSCGCLRSEVIKNRRRAVGGIKPNMSFGNLITIKRLNEQDNAHNDYWLCKCICGNITKATTRNLKSGNTTSCGCVKSKGEQKITSILQKNNINFISQYSFDDLYINKGRAKFDFAIFVKDKLHCLIEYNGIQHYDKNNGWYNPQSDKKKQEYCNAKKIPLIIIPYTEYNNITWKYIKEKCVL